MHIKLVQYIQTEKPKTTKKKMKMASARKPELFVWTDNEVELLLQLTLDYKVSKLKETRTQAVVHHCCCATSQGSEVKVCGDGVINTESMQIRRAHKNARAAFSPGFSKKCVFRLRVDDQPKQFKTCALTIKCVSVWKGPKSHDHLL